MNWSENKQWIDLDSDGEEQDYTPLEPRYRCLDCKSEFFNPTFIGYGKQPLRCPNCLSTNIEFLKDKKKKQELKEKYTLLKTTSYDVKVEIEGGEPTTYVDDWEYSGNHDKEED